MEKEMIPLDAAAANGQIPPEFDNMDGNNN